jgi:protoporphyrinogen oxidase
MRVAVIGAGVTGLVEAGHEADVYERWPGLGGQVATMDIGDGILLERYYHHLFTTDRHIAALYEELGIDDAIEWLPSSVAVFARGRTYPFTSPLDLMRFKPLSLRSRVRTGLAVVRLGRRHRDVAGVEGTTARRWIESNMGVQVWEELWGPLLRGKFGDRADDVSMAWLWSKLTLRRRIEGGGARREMLGYPRGGWQPLLERLRERIERSGRVLIDRPAARISRAGTGFEVAWGGPDSFRSGHDPRRYQRAGSETYDAVLATTPNQIFEGLLDDGLRGAVGGDYLSRLDSIEYHAALCMLLELDRPFGTYYWTNVADRSLPFIGLIEQNKLVGPERYGGRHFLYVANYRAQGDELLQLDPERLFDRYEPGLRAVNGKFSSDWVKRMWVFQEPDAQPIVDLGYAGRIPPLRTGVPGLVLANTTQIYPEDRGTNYSVRLGNEAAETLTGG